MQCAQCQQGEMRLVRFRHRQEVFACRDCDYETLLLDCHYCERRSVSRLADSETGIARWVCQRCQVVQHKCPVCSKGWVVADVTASVASGGEVDSNATGCSCQHCGSHWQAAELITAAG